MADSHAAETCICSACQQLMLDMDGNARKPSTAAHELRAETSRAHGLQQEVHAGLQLKQARRRQGLHDCTQKVPAGLGRAAGRSSEKMDALAILAWRAAGTQDATDVEVLKASESDGGLRAVGTTNLDNGPRPGDGNSTAGGAPAE
eukprot:770849-Pleurochrysis_carterae.AAC.1